MKKQLLLFGLFALIAFSGMAQEKKLTLADAARQNTEIQAKRLRNLQWMGDGDTFVYVENDALIKGTPQNEKRDTILRKQEINEKMRNIGEKLTPSFPRISFLGKDKFTFTVNRKLIAYTLSAKNMEQVNNYPDESENIDIHYGSLRIAYTMGNNLFFSEKGKETAITADKSEFIVNGQAAHRSEFGIEKGIFWSPNGNKLAFYRMDEGMVTEYPIVDVSTRIATETPIRYPMAGMTSHEVTVGVYDIATKKTFFLQPQKDAEKDQYWTNITWSPDAKYLYVAIVNRDQDRMELCQFDAANGAYLQTIFTETNKRYVEPMHELVFLPENTMKFLWNSRRDGYNHLYLCDLSDKSLRQITKGAWEVSDVFGFDEKGENVFFTATKESPIEQNIYGCNIKSGVVTRISSDHGVHAPMLNKKGTMIIDQFSNTETAYTAKIETPKGKIVQTLFESPNPLKDYVLGEMTIDKIKSDNGVDLYYRLIKPVGLDPSKKYPVIVYVYGGPHAQMITDSWLGGNDVFLYYLAQEGFVVFTVDNQGTANRGFEFESIIHRNVGVQESKDQMAGINFLKQFPWVDGERIGIDGWSYGGFMTINMLLTYPGVFKAGCAGGPVCDWKYYEVMYGERYMDTPEQNPDGYKNSSLIERAGGLKDRLLIIHGDKDPTVVWQNSLSFVKKCVDEGIQLDYFVYPGHEHNVRGKDRIHLYQKIFNYFDEQLR